MKITSYLSGPTDFFHCSENQTNDLIGIAISTWSSSTTSV